MRTNQYLHSACSVSAPTCQPAEGHGRIVVVSSWKRCKGRHALVLMASIPVHYKLLELYKSMKASYRSSNNVCDLHAMVIHHIRQMICRVSIWLHHNGIVVNSVNQVHFTAVGFILPRLAIDQVVEHGISFHLQPDHVGFAVGCSIRRLFRGYGRAFSVISRCQTRLASVACERIEALGGAEAAIGMAVGDQFVGMGSVQSCSLGLWVSHVSSGRYTPRTLHFTCLYGPYGPPTTGPTNTVSVHFFSLLQVCVL